MSKRKEVFKIGFWMFVFAWIVFWYAMRKPSMSLGGLVELMRKDPYEAYEKWEGGYVRWNIPDIKRTDYGFYQSTIGGVEINLWLFNHTTGRPVPNLSNKPVHLVKGWASVESDSIHVNCTSIE